MKRDMRDHLVMLIVTLILIAGTFYLFKYHSDGNYLAWGGLVATLVSAYHWLNIWDDKKGDT
jgi:hypothetical protein